MIERIDDPDRMASAIEEILRVTPIGPGRPRITRGEIDLSGTTVASGEVLFLSTLAANYDESVFPHASEIDFDRTGGAGAARLACTHAPPPRSPQGTLH